MSCPSSKHLHLPYRITAEPELHPLPLARIPFRRHQDPYGWRGRVLAEPKLASINCSSLIPRPHHGKYFWMCTTFPSFVHVSSGPCDLNRTRCRSLPHTALALSTGTTMHLENIRNQRPYFNGMPVGYGHDFLTSSNFLVSAAS